MNCASLLNSVEACLDKYMIFVINDRDKGMDAKGESAEIAVEASGFRRGNIWIFCRSTNCWTETRQIQSWPGLISRFVIFKS